MLKFRLDQKANTNETSFVGAVELAPAGLVARFGQPREVDRHKVSGQFVFVSDSGEVFTVYDWKSTSLYDDTVGDDGLPMLWTPEEFWAQSELYDFQIGGHESANVPAFSIWLIRQVA